MTIEETLRNVCSEAYWYGEDTGDYDMKHAHDRKWFQDAVTALQNTVKGPGEAVNKCDTCGEHFGTCGAKRIVWGIDRDPSARGADADKVLECDSYTPNKERATT